jgi:hypothetical protein
MRSVSSIGLVTFTLAVGCSSSTPAVPTDASASGVDSSAGSSDASGNPSDASPSEASLEDAAMGAPAFVGTWARSGNEALTCGPHELDASLDGNLVIALGTAASSIVATQPGGCTTTYTVSGNVASAAAGQSCSVTTEAGIQSVATIITHTLTVSADGSTLAEASSASDVETFADGGVENCTLTTSGSFAKQ